MENRSPLPELLAWLGIVSLWAFAVWAWPRLPESIPTHFDLSGVPDAWSERSVWSWFGVPMIATASAALLSGLGVWISKNPQHVNLPGKDRILALPEKYRGEFDRLMREMMGWVSLEVAVIFGLVQIATWRSAQGLPAEGITLGIVALAVLSSPFLLAWIMLRTQKVVDDAWKRAKAEGVVEPTA